MFGVSGKLKFILVSALFVALGVPLAGSRTIAAEHSAATPPVSASAKNTTEEAAVKESEGAASDPSIPEVKLTSRILFQLIASEIALQRGQAGAAYQTYLTLAEETGDPRIAERAAQIALASNAPKEFQKAVSEWIKLSPDNPKAQEAFIASGIVSNQLDKVSGTAASFLAKSKDKGAEIIKLQTQLALMKDKAKALSFFRTVTAKYSKLYQTQLGLARLEALNGNVSAAEKYSKNAFRTVENEETVLTYGSALLRTNPKEAEQILARYLKKNPKAVRIRDAYSQLLFQTKNFDALNVLEKEYRDDDRYLIALAISYVQISEVKKAKTILESVVERLKNNPDDENLSRAYLLLSDIAADEKELPKALDYASKVKGKLTAAAALQTANIYSRESKWDDALKALDTIKEDQEPAIVEEAALFKARILLETKGEKTAFDALNASLISMPYSKALHYEAAMLAERLDDIKTAEFHLKKAIEIDPGFAIAYNSLGYTLLEQTKRIKEAERYINQAYQLDPRNPYILDSKGWLAFKQKKYIKAIEYLNDALKLQKELDIYLHLAEVYWTQGNKRKAADVLKEAEKLWPDAAELSALKKRLKMPNAQN